MIHKKRVFIFLYFKNGQTIKLNIEFPMYGDYEYVIVSKCNLSTVLQTKNECLYLIDNEIGLKTRKIQAKNGWNASSYGISNFNNNIAHFPANMRFAIFFFVYKLQRIITALTMQIETKQKHQTEEKKSNKITKRVYVITHRSISICNQNLIGNAPINNQ